MAKKSIKEVRQDELSQAAFEILVEFGIRGTTIDRIAKRAGISKGVVLHYFKDKDALFEAVMRRANTLLRDGVIELLRHAETPMERLSAIIVGNFSDPVFYQEVCRAWISLCADAPYNQQNQRIQTVIHARMQSNLLSALSPIMERELAEKIAFQISTAIDGVWLRASVQQTPMSSQQGIGYVNETVLLTLSNTSISPVSFKQATAKMENLGGIILNSKAFSEKALSVR
ncbi:transcriptional regulator BetI [Pelagimonas sp. KU-00592-HH]|uniref:transcriptional regulator BetI n=1 Tax=Pelagimonas sp. KU-00592-HH TaxID=3127651 RepID=UPI00310B2972